MKRAIILGVGLASLTVLPAAAADMPARVPVKAPIAAPVAYSWSGCYVGGNAGGTWGRSSNSWSGITESATGFAAGAATVLPAAANVDLNGTGFTGGGQLGCNYQSGPFVIGLEGDFEYTGLNVSRTATSLGNTNGGPATIVPGAITENFTSNWLSTIRGRAGFASGQWLVYATGGLAIADLRLFDQVCFPTAATPACNTASSSAVRLGWTVGGGVEWMFAPNWSVRAEYLYVDLGQVTNTSILTTPAGAVPFPNAGITHNHRVTENIARLGLNYKFDWGGPLVARY